MIQNTTSSWQTKYAVVEHYPDGNSSIIATFITEIQAQCYAQQHNQYLLDDNLPLTVKQIKTMRIL